MSAQVKWEGLDEFREAMRNLPDQLAADAKEIVQQAADNAESEIRAAYHRGKTGNLINGLKQIPRQTSPWGTAITLKNTAPHSWLWDNGSEARHYYESSGTRHDTGAMWGRSTPPHTFVRGTTKWRRWMYDQLTAMMVRAGLLVRRDDAAA